MSKRRMPRPPLELARRVAWWVCQHTKDEHVPDLAERAGLSKVTVYRLQTLPQGRDFYAGSVEALADALGVDPGAFFQPIPDDKDRPA